jgi:hypothetical protein
MDFPWCDPGTPDQLRSRLLTEPRILVRIWHHPGRPSADASDEGGISGRANLNEQATDPKSHTLVRVTYTLSSPVRSPANSDGRP